MVEKVADEIGVCRDLTRRIIGSAIEVHRALGPGLLESAYEACLCDELDRDQLRYQRQVDLPVIYKGRRINCGYRIDVLVEDQVVLELKSIEKVMPIHEAQLLTYLRLAERRVGLLINFNVAVLRRGIVRRVL